MLRIFTFLVTSMLPMGLAAQSLTVGLSADAKDDATISAESTAGASGGVSKQAASAVSEPDAVSSAASEAMPATLSGRLALGLRRWNAKDFRGALAAFEAARELDQGNLSLLLFVGGMYFQLNELDAATQAYAAIVSLATESDAALKAKALMGMARVAEARYDLEGAKLAWTSYRSFVSTRPSIPSFADTAENRLKAIEHKETLATQYEVVQRRLADDRQATEEASPAPSDAAAKRVDIK